MKKQELLNHIDQNLLDRLFGFCYARTRDSHEAEELCSDILFAIVKAANLEGDVDAPEAFLWRIARNVYADFAEKRSRRDRVTYAGDPEDAFAVLPDSEETDETREALRPVYRRIAFLTRAYREVMIDYYLDGLPIAVIAKRQKTSETAIRQRLFSARNTIRNEVITMDHEKNKPIALDKIDFVIWGTGNPSWGDPRNGFIRQFSKHIVALCKEKPRTAREISEELNVPTAYVEEELEILRKGENGKYGLLRKNDSGKYALNLILFSEKEIEEAQRIYTSRIPMICDTVAAFVERHKEEYLSYPYLNRKVDFNLVLWSQVHKIGYLFGSEVRRCLKRSELGALPRPDRKFSVYGYVDNGKYYGGACDGTVAQNLCGYSEVYVKNIYVTRLKRHFSCSHNIATDGKLQLAIRAIDGLSVTDLTEDEKEQAAKAIAEGYLYREGDLLYTKILVARGEDYDREFSVTEGLAAEFREEAEKAAEEVIDFLRRTVPPELMADYAHGNALATLPVVDALVESLIERGLLTPPEDGIGAEGCSMFVTK